MDTESTLADLHRRAELGGGEERLKRQRAAGKLTARERIDLLFDPGSFEELDKFVTHRCRDFGMADQVVPGDGVVSGHGRVDGRLTYAFAQDFTVFGGSLSETNAAKIVKIMDLAMKMGAPVVGLNDSGGARIQEGVLSLGGYADIFLRNTLASGVIPQISAIMGPCAGGAVYSPAITDFTIMVKDTSYMFVTGPDVVRTVMHEQVTMEDLGGARAHSEKSGVAHFTANDDQACILLIRELLSLFPSNNLDDAPRVPTDDPLDRADATLDTIVPEASTQAYDMLDVVRHVVDDGYFLEVQPDYAKNLLVGFTRLAGKPVGVVANQPLHLAGVLDINAVREGRPLRPLLRRLQYPAGYVRGRAGLPSRHRAGARRHHPPWGQAPLRLCRGHGAEGHGDHPQGLRRRLLRDVEQAHSRRRQLRVAHRGDRGDGRGGAVNILYKRELEAAADMAAARTAKIAEYREKFANPYVAAQRGFIDEVIAPRETRSKIIAALAALETKRDKNPPKKHGNIPL